MAYASRTLTKSERKYCVTRKEMLSVVNFVKYFRHYLYNQKFTIRTDHSSLRWLRNFKKPEEQVARWLEILSTYVFSIEHRQGKLHANADGVSRIPCKQCDGHHNNIVAQLNVVSGNILQDEEVGVIAIREAQDLDLDIMMVKQWIEDGEQPQLQEISRESYFLRSLWNQWPLLEIKDGLVVRKWEVLGTDMVKWLAIVSLKCRKAVLNYSHDIRASGHLGIAKTLSKIRQQYYWPGLQNDVRTYVSGCIKCMKRKAPNP